MSNMHNSFRQKWTKCGTIFVFLLGVPLAFGQPADESPDAERSLWQRETLTNNWFGLGRRLEQNGISVGLGLTEVYQANLRDGTESDVARQSGSYDLELRLDLETLAGLRGATVYALAEGSWSGGAGLESAAVDSLFGVNDDFGGERSIDVTELWFEQHWMNDRLRLRMGKLDLSGGFECRGCPASFDANQYANDETAQFLNGALVNNPTIPFPDNGLGMMLYFSPLPGWYASAGAADAKGDARTTGFDTAFDGDHDYFYICETGIVPLIRTDKGPMPGSYRIGVWHDRQPKSEWNGGSDDSDTGFYASFDQLVYRENTEDKQGLGLFGRLGWGDDDIQANSFDSFISGGMQYTGLLPEREEDKLGIGFAYGNTNDKGAFSANYENVVEAYYNAELTPWLRVTPDVQWVSNPGGADAGGDALICGLRAQVTF